MEELERDGADMQKMKNWTGKLAFSRMDQDVLNATIMATAKTFRLGIDTSPSSFRKSPKTLLASSRAIPGRSLSGAGDCFLYQSLVET